MDGTSFDNHVSAEDQLVPQVPQSPTLVGEAFETPKKALILAGGGFSSVVSFHYSATVSSPLLLFSRGQLDIKFMAVSALSK